MAARRIFVRDASEISDAINSLQVRLQDLKIPEHIELDVNEPTDFIREGTNIGCTNPFCYKRGKEYICYDGWCECNRYQEYLRQQEGTERG